MKKSIVFYFIMLIALVPFSTVFAADDDKSDLPWETFHLNLGYYIANLDSSFRFGGSGLGVELDVEDFLGLDTNDTSFRIDAGYRFGSTRRHKVNFSWFGFHRDATTSLLQGITLPNGTPLPIGTTVNSIFEFDIIKLTYNYSLIFDDRINLYLGGGLYIMPIKFGLGPAGAERTEEDITAPLPVVSLGFEVTLAPKWFLRQRIDMFYLDIGDFKGGIMDSGFSVEYYAWKHVALGVGLDGLRVFVEAESETDFPGIENFVGDVSFTYWGTQLYLKFYF
jgi:hypothetical protein